MVWWRFSLADNYIDLRSKISSIKAYKHWLIACSNMPYVIQWWLLFSILMLIILRRERNASQNPNDENNVRTASGITAYKWWYSIPEEATHKRIWDSPDAVTRSQSDRTYFRRTFRPTLPNVRTQKITYIGSDHLCGDTKCQTPEKQNYWEHYKKWHYETYSHHFKLNLKNRYQGL